MGWRTALLTQPQNPMNGFGRSHLWTYGKHRPCPPLCPGLLREARLAGGDGQVLVWPQSRSLTLQPCPHLRASPSRGSFYHPWSHPHHTQGPLTRAPDVRPGLLNLPDKKRPTVFQVPERVLPEPPPWLLITPEGWEMRGLLNEFTPDPLSQVGSPYTSSPAQIAGQATPPLVPLQAPRCCTQCPSGPTWELPTLCLGSSQPS